MVETERKNSYHIILIKMLAKTGMAYFINTIYFQRAMGRQYIANLFQSSVGVAHLLHELLHLLYRSCHS